MINKKEKGSATVLSAGIILCISIIFYFVIYIVSAVSLRHKAQGAADLAALAGAQDIFSEQLDACEIAKNIVAQNGASLINCEKEEYDLLVTVQISKKQGLLDMTSTANARAGPEDSK